MAKVNKKSDAALKQDVIRELKWDPRIDETRIGVEVEGGIVTLTGSIESYAERLAAQEAAHRVHGVSDVVNDIYVKYSGTRTDADIAKAVRHALEWDVFVPEARIQSTVSGGVVTLEGLVDHFSQLEDAARVVRLLAGVQDIVNKIQVKPSADSSQVREAIEAALERHAAREARHIQLDVYDGKVILQGKVHSWAEREVVVGAARGTHGVCNVEDHLQVL